MQLSSSHFSAYSAIMCKDIPDINITEMIAELTANAVFMMATETDFAITTKTTGAIVHILKSQKYKWMPFHLVMEGFTRGAMGELGGTTRFTVRNVCTWMNAMFEKHTILQVEQVSKTDSRRRADEERSFRMQQKNSTIYGVALHWKIAHCPMPDELYDRLTLDAIVAAFKKGYSFTELKPEMI